MRLSRLAAVVSMAILAISGCDLLQENAVVTVKLADAPVDPALVQGVSVTFTGLQLIPAGEEGGDVTWTFDDPRMVDLLTLTNGDTFTLLDAATLPAGTYAQMRFFVGLEDPEQGAPVTPASYATINGTDRPLYVPSGAESGYKAVFNGSVDVPANGVVSFVVDWDVRKALIRANDRYMLKPTFRVVVEDQAGAIAGSVVNPGGSPLVVFAYETGTFDVSETQAPTGQESWFPNAVSSDLVEDEDGKSVFRVSHLAEGSYDLVLATLEATTGTYTVVGSPDPAAATYIESLGSIDVTAGEVTAGISITL